jgi:hypothetical protein
MRQKLSPDRAWQALDRMVAEENAEDAARVDALSGAALDQELAAHGLDPMAERARALAVIQKVAASRKPRVAAKKQAAPRKRASVIGYASGVGIAASFAAGVMSASGVFTGATEVGHGVDPLEAAGRLRAEAATLAGEAHWKESLEKLDRAKQMDPTGDRSPESQKLRKLDEEKLGGAK